MQLGEPSRMQSNINVTPLVDVVLVLLIIFMVMAPYMNKGPGPEIDMPATQKPPQQGEDRPRVVVTIDERGSLWVDDQQMAAERFADGLRAAASVEPDTKVVIQGDARLRFGDVRRAMHAVDEAGFHGVGLIAERSKAQGD